jgi:hypothetical protein
MSNFLVKLSTMVSVLTALCLLLTGCLMAPIPVKMRVEGAMNAPEKGYKPDTAFIHVGQTSKAEVSQTLAWANVQLKSERLFMARWISSSSSTIWMVGGNGGGMAGGERNWNIHTLVVEFDEKDVVRRVATIGEEDLASQLVVWAMEAGEPQPDLSKHIELSIEHHHRPGKGNNGTAYRSAKLILSPETFEMLEPDEPKHSFTLPRTKLGAMEGAGIFGKDPHPFPSLVDETIHFNQRTAVGSKMTFRLQAADLLVLAQFLDKIPSQALNLRRYRNRESHPTPLRPFPSVPVCRNYLD